MKIFRRKSEEAKAVTKAIALLDEKGPSDWRERVNLETLDINSYDECVLGQVFRVPGRYASGFTVGRSVLGLDHCVNLGAFTGERHLPEWKRQIAKGRR